MHTLTHIHTRTCTHTLLSPLFVFSLLLTTQQVLPDHGKRNGSSSTFNFYVILNLRIRKHCIRLHSTNTHARTHPHTHPPTHNTHTHTHTGCCMMRCWQDYTHKVPLCITCGVYTHTHHTGSVKMRLKVLRTTPTRCVPLCCGVCTHTHTHTHTHRISADEVVL